MIDIAIIGAGPAGLTAAIYGARAGFQVTVFEELIYGGQITNTPEVENYPAMPGISGAQFSMQLYEQAVSLGAAVEFSQVEQADLTGQVKRLTAGGREYEARSVIIANGVKRRPLGVAGEEKFTGRGISYCATCDGSFFKGKDTMVVGGGNTALEDALYLANLARTVYLVHRREEFRGEEALVRKVKERENIRLCLGQVVAALEGEEKLSGVRLKNVVTGEEAFHAVEGLFVAIGLMPQNERFAGQLILEGGYIAAGEDTRTNLEGVFAAGDTRTKTLRQLVTATADGAMAATQCALYLQSK